MKRFLCLLLCGLLSLGCALGEASAPDWLGDFDQPEADAHVTDETVYNAADEVGTVVNADAPTEPTQEERITYSFTPLEAVLVLDTSGSMTASSAQTGKSLLSCAQDAAIAFCQTLFAINPASRVAVVQYDSAAGTVAQLTGLDGEASLRTAIRAMQAWGSTNTGGGYELADSLLSEGARADTSQVVLILTDGLANEGSDNPIQYAIEAGRAAAQNSRVYTIGLVGGMSEADKGITRQILNEGYETRYYEVDFDEVAEVPRELQAAFMAIAVSGGMADDGSDAECYSFWADGGLDVRMEGETGESLASSLTEDSASASFGYLSTLGESMDQKMSVLTQGSYRIYLHGSKTGTGSFRLTSIQGASAMERTLIEENVQTHPALCKIITLENGEVTVEDVSYEPLDITAVDPFTGERTRGLQSPALAQLTKSAEVKPAPDDKAPRMEKLGKGTSVRLLAMVEEGGWYFIEYISGEGRTSRGWVKGSAVKTDGYVPLMVWLTGEYTLSADAQAYAAPAFTSEPMELLLAGSRVALKHVERDVSDAEWAYVEVLDAKKPTYCYLPASALSGWQPMAPAGFRLGYAEASFVWEQTIGSNGYTEVMWAAAEADESGVVLSGRSSATKGELVATQGDRDAFALRLDQDGSLAQVVTAGGSEMDSYHCIVPSGDGYFVSGVTRSNDKQFENIWDEYSHTNETTATTKRTNALIGELDADFGIRWLKSFGIGHQSYGFDMVVPLADGNIAGIGWMRRGSGEMVPGYGEQDFYVVKLTPEGTILNMVNVGTGVDEVPDSAVATPDGGLIMVGSQERGGVADGYIVVLNEDLVVVSQCTYGGSGEDIFDNVRALSDGTFLVTGFTDSPSGNGVGGSKGGSDFWVMNIDSLGRSIWSRRYGGSGDEELCGTTILADGRCLLVGSTTSSDGDVGAHAGKGKQDAWVMCIDQTGRLLWQYAIGGKGNDYFNAAALDPTDGGVVLAGCYDRSSDKKSKGYIVKLMPPAFEGAAP